MVHNGVDAVDQLSRGEAWCQGRGGNGDAGCSFCATAASSTENQVRVVGADSESKYVCAKYRFNGTEWFQDKLEIT
jgi:hypothetical protein